MDVKLGTDGVTFPVTLSSFTGLVNTTYVEVVYDLSAYTGQTVYIRFNGLYGAGGGGFGICIDDILMEPIPPCMYPTSLTASSITNNSANISWTAGGSETNWEYVYGVSPLTAPTGAGTATATNPTSLTGLTGATTYQYYVRASCVSSGTFSSWQGPYTFTTLCDNVTDFTQNFDAVTSPAFPNCWAKVGTGGSASTQGSSASSSPNCLYIYGTSSSSRAVVAMPPVSNAGDGTHQLTFKIRGNYTAGDSLQIGYMTDRASDASFVKVIGVKANALTYEQFTVKLGTAPGANTTLAFRHAGYLGYSILIDDVSWEIIPPCPPVSAPAATPGNTFANLSWTETGAATAWDIEWGTTAFVQGAGTLVTGVTNPYVLSGLAPVTGYSYFVRAACDLGELSSWSARKTFTTLVACPPPTSLDARATTETTADLRWVETGTATTWNLEYGPYGFTRGTGTTITGITAIPYHLTGLSAGTTYSFYVQADCGSGTTSTWGGPGNFVTSCGATAVTAFPFTQDFALGVVPPNCWSTVITNADYTWQYTSATPGYAQVLYDDLYAAPQDEWLITPALNFTGLAHPRVSFAWVASYYWAVDPYNDYDLDLKISTDGGTTWTQLWNEESEGVFTSWVWYNKSIDLLAYAGQANVKIAWDYVGTDGAEAGIDNIVVDETPSCYPPTALTATSITATGASLGWTPGASETSWEYVIGVSPVTMPTGAGTATTTNPTPVTGLTGNTTYMFWVRSTCGGTAGNSTWTSATFKTACSATTLPLAESFDGTTFAPDCWSNVKTAGTSTPGLWDRVTTGTYPTCTNHSGAGMARFNSFSISTGGKAELSTPALTFPDANYKVDFFMYRDGGYATAFDSVNVYFSTTASATGATLLGTIHRNNLMTPAEATANAWYEYSFMMPTGISGVGYIVFEAVSEYGNNIFLDDVTLVSAAPPTITLSLTNVRLEGLYAGITNPLNPAYDDSGLHWPVGVADHITVELHDATTYASIVYSATDVELLQDATATVVIPNSYNGTYYITVKHRNSLETVSANPVSFATSTVSQSFGTPADVFGANLAGFEDGGYAIFGGDVVNDGLVDSSDMANVDNLAAFSTSGYLPEDCNGDGLVDSSDMAIIDNNAASSLYAQTP